MAGIDVVVPCYNYGRFLPECVGSVLDQDVADLRILIIDNASADDTLEVAHRLAAEHPEVEVVSHRVNRGANFSYNEGIDWACADYFLLLDADDLLAPGSLRRAKSIMEQHPDLSFTHGIEAQLEPGADSLIVPDAVREPTWQITAGRQFIEEFCRTPVNIVGANTTVRRTSAQKRVGYYRANLPYSDDLEMWLRLATVGNVAFTGAVQAFRRVHEKQMSASYRSAQIRDFQEREAALMSFFAQEGRTIPQATGHLAAARRGLGEHAYWSALSHLYRGYWRVAFRLLRFSVERRGLMSVFPPLSWLFRMNDPVRRVQEIIMYPIASRRRRGSHWDRGEA